MKKVALVFAASLLIAFSVHQAIHFGHFGHLVPMGLHIDVTVTTSTDLLGVNGPANIYEASLKNYGILPKVIIACDYLNWAQQNDTMVNYAVERKTNKSANWQFVPEWDDYGQRLFCRPSFEVMNTHLVRKTLRPGQSLRLGDVIPGQWGGFNKGDEGRFTVFLNADGDGNHVLSSHSFVADRSQQTKTSFPLPTQ